MECKQMKLQITGKNMDILPTVRSYVERKLGKLSRHLANIMEAKVEIAEEKTKSPQHHFVVQVTINSNGTLLRGEERGESLITAIDKAEAVLNRQIEPRRQIKRRFDFVVAKNFAWLLIVSHLVSDQSRICIYVGFHIRQRLK